MENFIFQNPVKLIMGKGMIARLAKEIPSDKRIMITFGGGSVKKNGVYDQVKEALKNHFTVEFWGGSDPLLSVPGSEPGCLMWLHCHHYLKQ